MIDKIHFLVSIFIYSINAVICIMYYKIKSINTNNYNLSTEYISQKEIMDQISLGYSIFLLIFCLIYVVIYQEIYGLDLLKDAFINFFYILLSTNMIYINYKYFETIKTEENNFNKFGFDVPNFPLEKIRFILICIQGLFILLILFALIKALISYYRGLKVFILSYFENGGSILNFEIRNFLS